MNCLTTILFIAALTLMPSTVCSQTGNLQPTSGPGGGPVGALVLASDGDLFASQGGLYRSTDSGWSWHVIPAAPGGYRLAAGLNGDIWTWRYNGLWRTQDDGVTWTQLTAAPNVIRRLAFATSAQVFVAAASGLFVSKDYGATWSQVAGIPAVGVHTVIATAGVVTVGAGKTLYRSVDGGVSWSGVAELEGDVTAIAPHPEGGYYVGVAPGLWAQPVGGLTRVLLDGTVSSTGFNSHRVERIVVRSDGTVFAGSAGMHDGYNPYGMGLFRSTDGLTAWEGVGCGGYVNGLACDATDQIFAAMGPVFSDYLNLPACGVVKSIGPGEPWVRRNRGLRASMIFDLAASESGVVYAAADWTIAWTEDEGTSWHDVETPLPTLWPEEGTWQLSAHPDGTLFAANPSQPLRRSGNRGRTWAEVNPAYGTSHATVTPQGILFAATGGGELWRSADRGDTWKLLVGANIDNSAVALVSGPGNLVAFATPSFIAVFNADGGYESQLPTSGVPAFAPDERSLYVATGSEVQRWVENIGQWVQHPMPAYAAEKVVVDRDGIVYAATQTQVAWAYPGGPVWHELGSPPCMSGGRRQKPTLVFGNDGYLYVGTKCDGVYRSSTPARSPTSVAEPDGSLLSSWGCAPNPARGAITVRFDLVRSSPVHVSIYDVRGRLVKNLSNGKRFVSGPQEVRWTPDRATPSGVYSYRVRVGEVVRGGRIVLIR